MISMNRTIIAVLSLLIIALFTINIAKAASAEINANADIEMRPPFPKHWGPPPQMQIRDLVQLPGEYGRGSGTLRRWISEKMAEDDAVHAASIDDDGEIMWPEKSLVGLAGDIAKAAVLRGKSKLSAQNIQIVPHDAMVTMDYSEDRVRIFVGDDGTVVRQPKIG